MQNNLEYKDNFLGKKVDTLFFIPNNNNANTHLWER